MGEGLVAFFSGATAGLSVDVIIHPLDTIKTRVQSGVSLSEAVKHGKPLAGVSAVLLGSMPSAAVFFVTYEHFKYKTSPLVASVLSETAACFVRVPVEVAKQRMQKNPKLKIVEVYREILKNEKFSGLYRGFSSMLFREIPFACIQYPLWERLKRRMARRRGYNTKFDYIICGAISGGFSGFITTPLDYIKTKVMLADRNADLLKKNFLQITAETLRKESLSKLFSGAYPRTISLTIGGAIFLGIYDISRDLFRKVF